LLPEAQEINFDGLVGPTHNYAGLATGNLASQQHRHQVANPKAAARQGLLKMKALYNLGFGQGVLPPLPRPYLSLLRQVGFQGSDQQLLTKAYKTAPHLLAACYSASSMWLANAATVCPSADSQDGKVHFTPANLISNLHRFLEQQGTARLLQGIFADSRYFVHHPPLPDMADFADEGAANHSRLTAHHGQAGIQLFVYGAGIAGQPMSQRYPARQTLAACQAVARHHGLTEQKLVFAQQNPQAIDAGVFHNDVIAVANANLLFYHQQAFVDSPRVIAELEKKLAPAPLLTVQVAASDISLSQAVSSYLFNSQLLSFADDNKGMLLVVPQECRQDARVWHYLQAVLAGNNPINQLEVVDLKQSMSNGGGPACLRLRVVLTPEEQQAVAPGVFFSQGLFQQLMAWVTRHYRDRLSPEDLADPQLMIESYTALDGLSQILGLGSVYPFQLSGC
jgi:succinylarginine dihydrolase